MPGASTQFATPRGISLPSDSSTGAGRSSLCQEIRTSLTVMFAAYRLAHDTDDRLNPSEQQGLLERAEHHALRAESLLQTASRGLVRG